MNTISETLFSLTKEGFDVIFSEFPFDPLVMSIEMTKDNRCIRHLITRDEMLTRIDPDVALITKIENMMNEFEEK